MQRILALIAFIIAFALYLGPAHAQVTVSQAWVRATVPQQKATGAFMRLTSRSDARLVAARSPVAGVVEVHETTMTNDVMRMRPVEAVELPAGKTVELEPGGYHIMLMDLRRPLTEGESVVLTLVVENKDGKRENVEVKARVRPLTEGGHGGHH